VTQIRLRPIEPVIGIDASRLSVGQRTGTETYTWETLRAMAALNEPDAIRLYLNANALPSESNFPWDIRSIPFPRFWTHARLSLEIAIHPPGILWVPAHVIPINHPKSVVTIHDLGYLHVPEGHTDQQRRMLDYTTRWSVRAAAHIIAISETTKRDLVERYRAAEHNITVIPHGVNTSLTRPVDATIAETMQRLGLTRPFVLAVGTVQPRKNYDGLARALGAIKIAGLPHQLVIAGKRGWLADEVHRKIDASGNADRVHQLGYVSEHDLAALYAAADLMVFPSWYEGFGLPALEAMQCGTPVVSSNRGALPESVGDAGLIVDPGDEAALGQTLVRGLTDDALRQRLIAAGRRRAREFTWERTARLTLEVLRNQRDETFRRK
jgi:glycosyltransferase involved in cell wall biosynthesis